MATERSVDGGRDGEPPVARRQDLKRERMSALHRGPPSPGRRRAELKAPGSAPLPSDSTALGNYDGLGSGEAQPGHSGAGQGNRYCAWTEAADADARGAASSTESADRASDSVEGGGALGRRVAEAQPKVIPRRVLSPTMTDYADRRDRLRGCCDRCRSDLNGKLLARCSTCGFCRHLYCFSPPLKQHPALGARAEPNKSVSAVAAQSMVAQWKCEGCAVDPTGRAPSSPQRGQRGDVTATQSVKNTLRASKKRPRQTAPAASGTTSGPRYLVNVPISTLPPPVGSALEPNRTGESEPQGGEQLAAEFDWHRFRSEKAARVLPPADSRDELVFYSRSVALMRKTARFWLEYVHRKKLRSQLDARRQRRAAGPQIYDVKHELSAEDGSKLEASRLRRDAEEADVRRLFADGNAGAPYRRPPKWTLAAGEDVVGRVDAASDVPPGADVAAVAEALVGTVERVAMAAEDVDVCESLVVRDEARGSAHPSILGLHLAARVIQRLACVGRRARERLGREEDAAEPVTADESGRVELVDGEEQLECEPRHGRTQALLTCLALCARLTGVLLHRHRQRETQKALVALLSEPAPRPATPVQEDVAVDSEPKEVAADERRRAASALIRRFLRESVGQRAARRELAMARRIQRCWRRVARLRRWRVLASLSRQQARDATSRRIQRLFRGLSKLRAARKQLPRRRLRLLVRRWSAARPATRERARVALYDAALRLGCMSGDALADRPDASEAEILRAVGEALCRAGDWWSAAFVLEKRTLVARRGAPAGEDAAADEPLAAALAYAHHMAWHVSYDASNLARAHDLYCSSLERSVGPSVDPEVVQDLALVKMHAGDAGGSLRLLARLIECFPRDPGLPLWLLLAAAQLQQRGDWQQSVQYLAYVQDAPPAPYLERDVLVLCAVGLQRGEGPASATARKEAWRAALRLWAADKRTRGQEGRPAAGREAQSAQARLKWEAATDLAARALGAGHYLIAVQAYSFALVRLADAADRFAAGAAWWGLADAYRHLGRLDAYLEAAARSQEGGADAELVAAWRVHAEQGARSFQEELQRLAVVDKLRQLAPRE